MKKRGYRWCVKGAASIMSSPKAVTRLRNPSRKPMEAESSVNNSYIVSEGGMLIVVWTKS